MTRYLITGAGLIGSAIATRLLPDHEVVLFDSSPGDVPAGAQVIVGDVCDLAAMTDAARGADGIFHTAALHGIHLQEHAAGEFMNTNVLGTFNVLEAAAATGATRVVFSSTSGVIGEGASVAIGERSLRPVLTDDTPSLPNDIYGLSKVLCEEMCAFYRRRRGLEVVALRYGGVRQLVEKIAGHLPTEWASSGMLTDLEDAVEANLLAMQGPLPPRLAYNVLPRTEEVETRLQVEATAAEQELKLHFQWTPRRFVDLATATNEGTHA